jgi:hypothetical protein
MAKRRSRKLLKADRFRGRVGWLLRIAHSDWNEWEQDWLQDEAQRPDDTIYSEKEHVIDQKNWLQRRSPYGRVETINAGPRRRWRVRCCTGFRAVLPETFMPRCHSSASAIGATYRGDRAIANENMHRIAVSAMPLSGVDESDTDVVRRDSWRGWGVKISAITSAVPNRTGVPILHKTRSRQRPAGQPRRQVDRPRAAHILRPRSPR